MDHILVTVITATFNSEKKLPRLIESLENQTNKNFFWLVKDNNSYDSTTHLIKKSNLKYKIISGADAGIYDALNIALTQLNTPIYLTMGSDDILNNRAIENFYTSYQKNILLYCFAYQFQNKIIKPKKHLGFLFGMNGCSSSHSVGIFINKHVHEKYGFYNTNFKILADSLLIKTVVYQNRKNIFYSNKINGIYGEGGFSGKNQLSFLNEFFEIQMKTEKIKIIQIFLFFIRIIKYYLLKKI